MSEAAKRVLRLGAGAAIVLAAGLAPAATPLPKAVDTSALTMTGIGHTIAPPGASRKELPSRVPTEAMAMTGIDHTIAPSGASRKALPSQVPTDPLTMTGVGTSN